MIPPKILLWSGRNNVPGISVFEANSKSFGFVFPSWFPVFCASFPSGESAVFPLLQATHSVSPDCPVCFSIIAGIPGTGSQGCSRDSRILPEHTGRCWDPSWKHRSRAFSRRLRMESLQGRKRRLPTPLPGPSPEETIGENRSPYGRLQHGFRFGILASFHPSDRGNRQQNVVLGQFLRSTSFFMDFVLLFTTTTVGVASTCMAFANSPQYCMHMLTSAKGSGL